MYFGEYRDFYYNGAEQNSEILIVIPERSSIAVTAAVAVCLLTGHPEGTADEATLNVSL